MRVVICGAGVIGASVAYFLARRGLRPIVIEGTSIACAASGKSGGFLALDWCDRTPLEFLARRSFLLHARLPEELKADWGYRRVTTYGGSGGPGIRAGRERVAVVSYDAASPIALHSPGTRLIRELIADARLRGLEVFDFGLGEASYKAQLGAQVEPSAVLIRAATLRGWLGAWVLNRQRCAKITLKKYPRLLSALQRLNQFVAQVLAADGPHRRRASQR